MTGPMDVEEVKHVDGLYIEDLILRKDWFSHPSVASMMHPRPPSHTSCPLIRRIDQCQLVDLIITLAHETHNAKASGGSVSEAATSAGARLQSPASAGRHLDVEICRVAVFLGCAKLGLGPFLAGIERQSGCRATGTAIRKSRTAGELDADRVKTFSAAEGDAGCFGGCGHGWQAAEPGSVRAAGEVTLAQSRGESPVEGGEDGVVV